MLIRSLLTDQFFIVVMVVTPMSSIRFFFLNLVVSFTVSHSIFDIRLDIFPVFDMFDVVTERLLSTRMDLIANICGGSAAPRLVVRIRHCVDPLCCGNPKDQHGAVHSGGVVVVL
jgi:hypothetical protein